MRKRLVLGLFIWALGAPVLTAPASAGVIGLPAQEFTQLAVYAKDIQKYITQVQQLSVAFQEAQMMVMEGKNLVEHPSGNMMMNLMQLSSIVANSHGLAYSMGQLDKQFQQMYPSYNGHQDFTKAYGKWTDSSMKNIQGALAVVGLQGMNLKSEAAVMQEIQALSQSPLGRNQSIQLGNVISQQEVGQLMNLKQLTVLDMQTKYAYMGQQEQEKQAAQLNTQTVLQHVDRGADPRTY